jgi:hypothetical protein
MQAKAARRAGRVLGSWGVLYRARQEGTAPVKQGAARWGVAWQAWQGSGSMLACQQTGAKHTLHGVLLGGVVVL